MSRIRVNSIKPISGASVSVSGSLVVTGNVTAEEFVTERVSTSIIYKSGSTKFGDTADDRHQFTGTLDVTGSAIFTSSVDVTGTTNLSGTNTISGSNTLVGATSIGSINSGDTNLYGNIEYNSGETIFQPANKVIFNTRPSLGNGVNITGSALITTTLEIGGVSNVSESISINTTAINDVSSSFSTSETALSSSLALTITNLQTDLNVATASISVNETNIGTLTTDLTVATASISVNETNIGTLTTDLSVATSSIAANETNIGTLTTDLLVATASIAANEAIISGLTIATGSYALSASLTSDYININQLKAISSGSADFAAFQAAIALL